MADAAVEAELAFVRRLPEPGARAIVDDEPCRSW